MREEFVTLTLCKFLKDNFCDIIAFDFPGGGRRLVLHLNSELRKDKNTGIIIPDIVAGVLDRILFFENKVDYFAPDIEALSQLKAFNNYSSSIKKIQFNHGAIDASQIFIGVGLQNTKKNSEKIRKHFSELDFVLLVGEDKEVEVIWDKFSLFINFA
jgi:hypothetical protein